MERAKVLTSILSLVACKAAYTKCEYWLEEVKEYIWQDYIYVKEYMETSNLKGLIKPIPLEGSYLLFADNRSLMKEFNFDEEALKKFYSNDVILFDKLKSMYILSGTNIYKQET